MAGPHVTILMATCQGIRWLPEQLASFKAQTHPDWSVVASDDGSTDGTRELLDSWDERLSWREGPRRGAAANFLSLVRALPETPGWIAFSDQDDVWLPEKLARGIAAIEDQKAPSLYCSAVAITDEALNITGRSAAAPRPPGFRNALVQNIVTGHTILLNPPGAALLREAAQRTDRIFVHDWWSYLILTGAGGRIFRDEEPGVLYRQHGKNEMGAHQGWRARADRAATLLSGRYRDWTDLNLQALRNARNLLTPENAALLEAFAGMRTARFPRRLTLLSRLGLYRQTRATTLVLWAAAAMGRL